MESSIGDGSGGFLDVELIVEVAMRAREISLHFGDVGVAARPRATFVFVDFRIFVVEIGIDDMPRSERIDGEALVAQRVVSSPSRDDAAVLVRSEERRVGKEGVGTCRSRWSPYH